MLPFEENCLFIAGSNSNYIQTDHQPDYAELVSETSIGAAEKLWSLASC